MTMSSTAVLIFAAVTAVEGHGLAEMISNYARVSTNTGLALNGTQKYGSNATTPASEQVFNETDYEDFDDLEPAAEDSLSRQTVDPGTTLKFINGLISLLGLMYRFSGSSSPPKTGLRKRAENEGYLPAGQARYQPDTATKKFKYQTDQEQQPIGNYPPYNPLTANAAESYTPKIQTSYDADLEQYKFGDGGMSDYMSQSHDASVDVHQSFSYQKPSDGWNPAHQDYPEYKPWMDGEPKNPWKDHDSVYHHLGPVKKPVDYHDIILSEPPEDDHHHLIEDEDRESKRPYSYYFLGRKLWYIPLIFSVYFILYIGALVLKSVARHKIQFPDKIWDLKDEHYKHRRYREIDYVTERYENAMENVKNKIM